MTLSASAVAGPPVAPSAGTEYRPGVCNIGPAEITRRRRAGHLGLLVTVVLLVALIALHVPPLVRLLVALPAAGAASGYLQAVLKFCAGFASRGIFNFGQLGQSEQVADAAAHARDRSRANQIFLASLGIGIIVGVVAVILPL
jgi:hypothetical protein